MVEKTAVNGDLSLALFCPDRIERGSILTVTHNNSPSPSSLPPSLQSFKPFRTYSPIKQNKKTVKQETREKMCPRKTKSSKSPIGVRNKNGAEKEAGVESTSGNGSKASLPPLQSSTSTLQLPVDVALREETIVVLKKCGAVMREVCDKLTEEYRELDAKVHTATKESEHINSRMSEVSEGVKQLAQKIRDQEDTYKRVEAELESVEAQLVAIASEDVIDAVAQADLLEKREALHTQLDSMFGEKESLFAMKKERFELPMERKKLYDDWKVQVSKSTALAATRDIKERALREKTELLTSVEKLLRRMGATLDDGKEKEGMSTVKQTPSAKRSGNGGDSTIKSATSTPGSKKSKKSFSLLASIKRIFVKDKKEAEKKECAEGDAAGGKQGEEAKTSPAAAS